MKAFNVRVAIIEPGVIATRMNLDKAPIPAGSPYPHARRERAIFAKSLINNISPYVVGEKIREIVEATVGNSVIQLVRMRSRSLDGVRARPTKR
jgi:hypothetical protein